MILTQKMNPIKMKTSKLTSCAALGSVAALLFSAANTNAALIAYEGFDYAGGQSLTAVTENGGTGWAAAWEQGVTGVPGIPVSGTGMSLNFSQSPVLINDGSSHIFATGNTANKRDLATGVNMGSSTLYATMLIRSFIDDDQSGGGSLMRLEFFDGAGATGNMRGNVGIDNGALFVSAASGGFSPASGDSLSDAFQDETTYLLAMKRTGSGISASLIEADGDLSTLEPEPTSWQVNHDGLTGVTFNSLRLIMNGTDTGLRADELRVATSWDDAVAGMAIPEPGTYAVMMSLLCGGLVFYRRRMSRR